MKKLLTIAIPTYNRRGLLCRLLDHLKLQLTDEVEILVSDNASTDGTEELLVSDYAFAAYFRNDENLGADRNFLECYRRSNGRYILLMGSDDVVMEGAIDRILEFIRTKATNNMPLIFLNHVSFTGEYKGIEHCSIPFLGKDGSDRIIQSKEKFISIADRQLTYMSSFLLEREAYIRIDNPEQYFDTRFLHTYLAFEATSKSCDFGVVTFPCIAQDLTLDNTPEFIGKYSALFQVFGGLMKSVLVEFASRKGYDEKQMKRVYRNGMIKIFVSWMIRAKAYGDLEGVKGFWKYCYPAVKNYPVAWITVIPIAYLPSGISRLYLKITHHN